MKQVVLVVLTDRPYSKTFHDVCFSAFKKDRYPDVFSTVPVVTVCLKWKWVCIYLINNVVQLNSSLHPFIYKYIYFNDRCSSYIKWLNDRMCIAEQIINLIPKWFHGFIQDIGTYKYKYARFVSLHIFFSGINTKDNHLSTLTFVICYLSVMEHRWHWCKLFTNLF